QLGAVTLAMGNLARRQCLHHIHRLLLADDLAAGRAKIKFAGPHPQAPRTNTTSAVEAFASFAEVNDPVRTGFRRPYRRACRRRRPWPAFVRAIRSAPQ